MLPEAIMEPPSKKVRLEPDKKSYEDAMNTFKRALVANPPRSMATTQIALTKSAECRFAREYGVEVNILMTKLYGEERTRFGFDNAPETRHFALKVFGMVYEFGPFQERVKKSHFVDWYLNHLDFEFASIMDASFEFSLKPFRRPVVAYTMLTEQEFDVCVQKVRMFGRPYDPNNVNCFCFIKSGLLFLNRNASPDCEVQKWITKYQEFVGPGVKKTLHKITREMHQYAGVKGTCRVIDQVDLIQEQHEQAMKQQQSGKRKSKATLAPRLSRKRPAHTGNVIEQIDLSDD